MLNWLIEFYFGIVCLATQIDYQKNTHRVMHTIQNKKSMCVMPIGILKETETLSKTPYIAKTAQFPCILATKLFSFSCCFFKTT